MSRSRGLVVLTLALASSPRAARAETAAEHQVEAQRLYGEGQYRAALLHYERAFALAPDAAFLYSAARCRHQLDELEAAVAAYDRYLAAEKQDADGIAKARARREEALAELARRERAKPPAPAPPAAEPEPEPVPAPEPRAAPEAQAGVAAEAPAPSRWMRPAGWTAIAAGAAALGAGAYFGAQARAKSGEWEDAEQTGKDYDPDGMAIENDGERAQTLQWVALGTGGAAVVTGIVLLALDGAPTPASGSAASAAPGGLRVAF